MSLIMIQCVGQVAHVDRNVTFVSRISLQVSLVFAIILILGAVNNIFHIISAEFND